MSVLLPGNRAQPIQREFKMNAQVNIEDLITAQTFIPALQFVSHAMAKNDTRFFLKGVLVKVDTDNQLILVGTDGHRMAHCKISGSHRLTGEYREATTHRWSHGMDARRYGVGSFRPTAHIRMVAEAYI